MNKTINLTKLVFNTFILVLVIIIVQELVASRLLMLGIPGPIVKFSLIIKDMMVIGMGVFIWYKYRLKKVVVLFSAFIIMAVFYLLISPVPLSSAVQDFRIYPLLMSSFLLGYYLFRQNDFFKKFQQQLLLLFAFVIVFGFIEQFIFPQKMFSVFFPVDQLGMQVKGFAESEYYNDGLGANVFTDSGSKRILGPFGEPLYMAYFSIILLNFFFACWLYSGKKGKMLLFWVLCGVLCIILGKVRAIWIGSITSLLYYFSLKRNLHIVLVILVVIVCAFLVKSEAIIQAFASLFDLNNGSALGHLVAYTQGIPRIIEHPFGQGIGSAGFLSLLNLRSAGADISSLMGVENAYFNLIFEIGVVGVIFFMGLQIYIIHNGKKLLKKHIINLSYPEKVILLSGVLLNVQFLIAGFLAPHIMTAKILIPYWFFNGMALTTIIKHKNKPIEKLPAGNIDLQSLSNA